MVNKCTRDELEEIIEEYLDMTDNFTDAPVSFNDVLLFVAEKLDMDIDECDEEYGSIISALLSFDEDSYLKAMDSKYAESELKSDFREFWNKKKNDPKLNESAALEIVKQHLADDKMFSTLLSTPNFKNADEEKQYSMLWKYLIREYGKYLENEDELGDICCEYVLGEEDLNDDF